LFFKIKYYVVVVIFNEVIILIMNGTLSDLTIRTQTSYRHI